MARPTTALRLLALCALLSAAAATPGKRLDYGAFAALHARLLRGETAAQMEDELPGLAANIETAARVSKDYWTDCTVFDELAKADILAAPALDALGISRKEDGGVTHVPAGAMHTYGYLFSQLKTSYGLKGKRWLESRLDERLGLPAASFSPWAARGEFTSNVTRALLRLAGETPELARAAPLEPAAEAIGRLEQRVTWRVPDGGEVTAVVVTRLTALKPLRGAPAGDVALLGYEVVQDGRRRLVTAFPIDRKFADALAATPASKEPAFKPRFNLYVHPAWTVVAQETEGFIRATKRR